MPLTGKEMAKLAEKNGWVNPTERQPSPFQT